jgi:hypothetical protein
MSSDDDRIRGRLDEDQERLIAATAPLGFELRQPRKRPLEEHKLKAFEAADTVLTRLTGEVDGALVDLFEYDWVRPGTKGAVQRGRRIVAVLRHPAFEGEARCTWESFQSLVGKLVIWTLIAAVTIMIFYIVIPIWLYQYSKGENPFPKNWKVGNPEFEKRFKVNGPSLEQAKRALPIAMQSLVVAEGLTGPIEVRPGTLALGFDEKSLDPAMFEKVMRVTKRVVEAYAPPPAHAGAAYRVATDELEEAEPEEREEEAKLTR